MTAQIYQFTPAKPSEDAIQRAWEEYIAKREQAQRTGDINDMIASGNAFAKFHWLFVRQDQ